MRLLKAFPLKALPLFGLLLLVPVGMSSSGEVATNEACADGGATCCRSAMELCFLDPDNPRIGYYSKGNGLCTIVD